MDGATAREVLALARQAEPELLGPNASAWLDRLDEKGAQLEAAIDWLLGHDNAPAALEVAARLWRF
jgi:hypothetical protein